MKHSKELEFYTKRTGMSYRIEKDIWSMLNEEPPKMLLIDLNGQEKTEKIPGGPPGVGKGQMHQLLLL